MSTTSTNFAFVLATTADTVNVVTHVANNFNSIDSIFSQAHTGTGELKAGLSFSAATLSNPVVAGTLTGGNVVGTTGKFQTITATGGALTLNSLTIGTYAIPATVGSTNQILVVTTGNLVFASQVSTGASVALTNLATVAINTNLNTFSAGFVTVARIVSTSGALTGLTTFQATTGTFAGNLSVTGTMTANTVTATGGALTLNSLTIGTYSYPNTVGSTGQFLTVTTGNVVFGSASGWGMDFVSYGSFNATNSVLIPLTLTTGAMYRVVINGTNTTTGSIPLMQFDTTAAGVYAIFSNNATATAFGLAISASNLATVIVTSGANSFMLIDGIIYERGSRVFFNYSANVVGDNATNTRNNNLWVLHTTAATGLTLIDSVGGAGLAGNYRVYRMKTA